MVKSRGPRTERWETPYKEVWEEDSFTFAERADDET